MTSTRKYQLVQRILLLSGLFLALCLYLVYLPMSDRAAALDKPLQAAWLKLLKTHQVSATVDGVQFEQLDQRLKQLDFMTGRLENLRRQAVVRTALDRQIEERIQQPFQLVDFQNERQLRQEELERVAREKGVTLTPGLVAGYPEYSADLKEPSLLWGHLVMVHQALLSAVQSGVSNLVKVTVRPPRAISTGEENKSDPVLYELPITVQVTAPMLEMSRWLTLLPLRADEAKELRLPDLPAVKPALFIDRLVLRKEPGTEADLTQVEARLVGIVFKKPSP